MLTYNIIGNMKRKMLRMSSKNHEVMVNDHF